MEQLKGFADCCLGIPSAYLCITAHQEGIEVATVRHPHHVAQTLIVCGPSVSEMRAVDVNHDKRELSVGLMLIEEMKREGKQIVKVDCGDVEENIDNTSKRKALKRGKGL